MLGRVMSWITDPFRAAPEEGGEENPPAVNEEEPDKQEEVIKTYNPL